MRLSLSRRALLDIEDIETYSTEHWGKHVADEYLDSLQSALNLIRENPSLLKTKHSVSDSLCFYRVKQHFLVCSLFDTTIYVLAVRHGAMDLPNRIAEQESNLIEEAKLLHNAFLIGQAGTRTK